MARPLWQAESIGTLFEQTRVRRITQARDALSAVEERVYDLLWGGREDEAAHDPSRLVHCSLQRIAVEARINIKTVRELIPRLVDKGFLRVEHEADPKRNQPTLYRVWGYDAVLDDQRRRGRFFVIKTGKGVFYARPVSASLLPSEPMGVDITPIGVDPRPTGFTPTGHETNGRGSDPAGDFANLAGDPQKQISPATWTAMVETIRDAFHVDPEAAVLSEIVAECRRRAEETDGAPATEEELLYFAGVKAHALSHAPNIRNHLVVFRRALPECFTGPAFCAFRRAGVKV